MPQILLALFFVIALPGQAATITFYASGNVTSTAGSSAYVSATVSFTTLQDMVVVQIMNNIVGASRDVQGISSVDFRLSTGQTSGSIVSQAGIVRTIASNGTWVSGDTANARPGNFADSSYANDWSLQQGAALPNGLTQSFALTTLNGGNPTLTLFGASTGATANCCYNAYGNPNPAITKHNPYLISDGAPVAFTLLVPGVTVSTTILPGDSQVRFFFGTDRSAYLDGSNAPEAGSFAMIGMGLVGVGVLRRFSKVRTGPAGPPVGEEFTHDQPCEAPLCERVPTGCSTAR